MIPNQWYAILESGEVGRGRTIAATRLGERIVVWRNLDGQIAVMRDKCPHRGAALSAGRISDGTIECPFHGFLFDSSGRCAQIPANGKKAIPPKAMQVDTLPAREKYGFVFAWWGDARDSYPPLPELEAIDESFQFGTLRDQWAVHYSRAIENQLDVVHLPFVHSDTIGRGRRTVIDGPIVRWERDAAGQQVLNLWVSNRSDDGTSPARADQLPEPKRGPSLQLHMPNLWQNRISDKVRVVAVFAPIDDGNTMMYVRFYQRFLRVPLLSRLVTALAVVLNAHILGQDKRVVTTQRPVRSELRMGEKLIPGDAPIIAYRRRRDELLRQADSGGQGG